MRHARWEIGLPTPLPHASVIGVDYFFEPDVLVEVEATAIADGLFAGRVLQPDLSGQ